MSNTLWKYKSTLSTKPPKPSKCAKKYIFETHKYIFQEHKCGFFENTKVYWPRTKAQMWTSQLQCKDIFPKVLKVHLRITNVKMQKLIFTHESFKVQEYTFKTNNKPVKSEKMRERQQHTFWSQVIVVGASKFAHKSCEEQACSFKTKTGAFKNMCVCGLKVCTNECFCFENCKFGAMEAQWCSWKFTFVFISGVWNAQACYFSDEKAIPYFEIVFLLFKHLWNFPNVFCRPSMLQQVSSNRVYILLLCVPKWKWILNTENMINLGSSKKHFPIRIVWLSCNYYLSCRAKCLNAFLGMRCACVYARQTCAQHVPTLSDPSCIPKDLRRLKRRGLIMRFKVNWLTQLVFPFLASLAGSA